MSRGWPPLAQRDVLAILRARGFHYHKSSGGHDHYKGMRNGRKCKVTVDSKCRQFGPDLLRSMCKQAGCTHDEFYGATKLTAAKIDAGE